MEVTERQILDEEDGTAGRGEFSIVRISLHKPAKLIYWQGLIRFGLLTSPATRSLKYISSLLMIYSTVSITIRSKIFNVTFCSFYFNESTFLLFFLLRDRSSSLKARMKWHSCTIKYVSIVKLSYQFIQLIERIISLSMGGCKETKNFKGKEVEGGFLLIPNKVQNNNLLIFLTYFDFF